jgi:hypothetical protein
VYPRARGAGAGARAVRAVDRAPRAGRTADAAAHAHA